MGGLIFLLQPEKERKKYHEKSKVNEKRSIRRAVNHHFRVGELYLLILHIL